MHTEIYFFPDISDLTFLECTTTLVRDYLNTNLLKIRELRVLKYSGITNSQELILFTLVSLSFTFWEIIGITDHFSSWLLGVSQLEHFILSR